MTKQEKLEMTRQNITRVLTNSTVHPFKWLRSIYRCFYCYEEFKEPKQLLPHFGSHCKAEEITVAMSNYWETMVYVDVSKISCKLCPTKIENITGLVDHLVDRHQIELNKNVAIAMVPFKLDESSAKCLQCGYVFRSFAHLFVHTVRSHKPYSVVHCNICGQHFKSSRDMHHHKNKTHSKNEVKCTVCGLMMAVTKMKAHLQNFHGKKYSCFYCTEKFATHYQRTRHFIEVHKSRENLNCTYCTRTFVFESSLKRHVREIHLKEKDSVCDICGWEGFGRARMQRHMMKHSDERNIKCPDCDKSYKTKKTMRQHFRNMHQKSGKGFQLFSRLEDWGYQAPKKRDLRKFIATILEGSTIMPFRWYCNKFMCFFCCENFVDSSNLKDHTKEEHMEPKLQNLLRCRDIGHTRVKLDVSDASCTSCLKSFGTFQRILDHFVDEHSFVYEKDMLQYVHTFKLSDDDIRCEDCGESFKFFGTLLTHVNKCHNRVNAFLCEVCGQGYIAKSSLDYHVRTAHASSEGYMCSKCDRKFPTKNTLNNHYQSHKTSFKCPKCPELLKSRYLKKRHLAIVHNVKSTQFSCQHCDKMFTVKSAMLQHVSRVHLKEKTFSCEICGFKVFSKDLLKRHMVKHDDSRPFQCEYCKKCFQRKKTLDFHRRIHTNDRRYVCKECGKAFVQTASLKLHVRIHHSIGNDNT